MKLEDLVLQEVYKLRVPTEAQPRAVKLEGVEDDVELQRVEQQLQDLDILFQLDDLHFPEASELGQQVGHHIF